MTLSNIAELIGAGTVLHIGTEHGNCWLFSDCTKNLFTSEYMETFMDREVVNMYAHNGREKGRNCVELLPGIAIIVAGYESGSI